MCTAVFWCDAEVTHLRRTTTARDPNYIYWSAAVSVHNMLAVAASSNAESERMNSVLTALVTGPRNKLSATRIVQLGLMRMVLRGRWARTPRWWRKKGAGAHVAGAGVGAGVGAEAGAGAGAGMAAIFAPVRAAPRDEDAFEHVEDDNADLLDVALNAIAEGIAADELDADIDIAIAAGDGDSEIDEEDEDA